MDDPKQQYQASQRDFVVPKYFNFPRDIIDDWARIEMVGGLYADVSSVR